MKKFICKKTVKNKVVLKYPLMNENEFFIVSKSICELYDDWMSNNTEDIINNINYIKKTGSDHWILGQSSIKNIGIEHLIIEYREPTNLEKLKDIEYKIVEEGLDIEDLKKIRKKLYKFADYELTNEEWTIKTNLLIHIKEILEEERK